MDFEERTSSVIEQKRTHLFYSTKESCLLHFQECCRPGYIAGSYLLINSKRTPADTFSDSGHFCCSCDGNTYMVSERINQETQALETSQKDKRYTRRRFTMPHSIYVLLENQIKTVDKLAKNLEMIEK
jgi:hypothetical protein